MGAQEISAFLTWLAVRRHVSASTQNQALSALLFLYKQVLSVEIAPVPPVVRARTPERLPVVLSRDEVGAILKQLTGTERLFVMLLYGTGLRSVKQKAVAHATRAAGITKRVTPRTREGTASRPLTSVPNVVIYVRHDESRASILQIVIENIGHGLATDLRFTSSRPIPNRAWGLPGDSIQDASPMRDGPLLQGIPSLPPVIRERFHGVNTLGSRRHSATLRLS